MKSIRPLLFLGVFSLLIAWLIWPDRNQPDSPSHGESGDLIVEDLAPATLTDQSSGTTLRETLALEVDAVVPEVEKPEQPIDPESEFGKISVGIVDSFGNQVRHGKVLVLQHGKVIRTLVIDESDSRFHCELPASETYFVMVQPDSLQAGLIPQLVRSRKSKPEQVSTGESDLKNYAKFMVQLSADQWVKVDLEVGIPAQVFGRILGPHGAPAEGVLVRLSGLDRNSGALTESSMTNEFGEYAFEEVFPGNHRLKLHVDPLAVSGSESWNPPAPWDMEIMAGQGLDLGDTYLGGGQGSVSGWIVDQDGNPFPGLPVLCFSNQKVKEGLDPHTFVSELGRTVTNEEGLFQITGMKVGPIKISVTPDFNPRHVLGPGHPAMWEPNIEVDLESDGPHVDLGGIVVEDSRPFVLSGNLVFDDAWLASDLHSKGDLRISISQVKGAELPEGVRRNAVRKMKVRPDLAANTYRAVVETPMTPIEISFRLKGYSDLRFQVKPEALRTWARDIQIPSAFE
ncbi:MAG: hypothetical protein COA70_04575 [Planctomycetota bacterium]|nr:MAG: hypothetical protein COA70_04575 [Planctomycetota bacterium]